MLEYGLLPADGEFDPNMSGFSAGRFLAHLTILALLAGDNRTGWVTDGNIDVGGTYYRRQVFTADFPTAMRMGVGEEAPFRDPDSGIWTLPGPFETFDAPADMNHILTAVDLLPGHHYFATILLIDAQGRWSSFAEEFTTLKRRVTVRFEHLEVINDSDPSGTGEAALDFQVLRGQNHPGGLHLVASFHWEHGSISDKLQERHYTLTPFNFVSVQGFEPVTRSDREVVVRVWGTEFDGIFDPGGDEGAASRDVPLATPSGPGMESVLDQATLVAVTPSTDGSDFECRVTVRHSVEYAP